MRKTWLVGLGLVVVLAAVGGFLFAKRHGLNKTRAPAGAGPAEASAASPETRAARPGEAPPKASAADEPPAPPADPTLAALRRDLQQPGTPRFDAAVALVRRGKEGTEILVEAMKRDPGVQPAAELAFQQAGGEAVVPVLVGLLKSDDDNVRLLAAKVLSNLGPKAKDAVPALIAGLKSKKDSITEGTGPTMDDFGENVSGLARKSRTLRGTFAAALGRIGPAAHDAVPVLCEALSDKHWIIRQQAATALGLVGAAEEAVPALRKALPDEQYGVRIAVLATFGRMGKSAKAAVPDVVSQLRPRYKGEDLPAEVYVRTRIAAAGALGGIGAAARDKPTVAALSRMYQSDPDNRARQAAGEALKKVDPAEASKLGIR